MGSRGNHQQTHRDRHHGTLKDSTNLDSLEIMKPRNNSAFSLCTVTLSLLAAGSVMAQTWDGGGADNKWSTGLNWLSDTAPASGAVTFAGGVQTATNNDNAANTSFGQINFTNDGLANTAAFTLNGNAITLNNNIVTTSIAAGGTAITDVINLDMILNGNRTVSTNGNHSATINGILSETGGARALIKGGSFPSGTLTLSANNTYTGITVIQTGTLTVSKIADSAPGAESNLGFGNSLRMGFGGTTATLNYTGGGNTTTRTVQLGDSGQATGTGGASISASGPNGGTGLVFSAPNFTISQTSTAASRTLTLLGSNTDANQVSGIIGDVDTDATPTATNVTKSNAGRWILAGDNTYTGASSITSGNLNIRHANALGSTIAGTTVSNGGQLELEGSAISFGAEALTLNSGTTGTAMLRNVSGSNIWNGSITASTVAGVANLARIQSDAGTLTLAGGMSGAGADNSFVLQGAGNIDVTGVVSGAIRMNSGSTGAGVRSLSNANTYAGSTTVGGGVLRLNSVTAVPGGIATSGGTSNINIGAGILGLGSNNLTRPLGAGVDQIQLTASNAGFAAYGADRSVNLGGASAALAFGDDGFFFGVTGNPSLVLGASSATHTLDFQNPLVLNGIKFFRIDNGSADVDARLSGAVTGSTSFSKTGAGTLELTNTGNAWTGTTFIDSGTLRLGASNVIPQSNLTVKRANGSSANGVFDLGGFSETIGGLTLGEADPDGSNVGQTPLVTNSVGTTATLALGGTVTYLAGPGAGVSTNGQATISANLILIGSDNFDRVFQVANSPVDVDLRVTGDMTSTGVSRGLIKNGTGTMMISGTNNYTGQTKIVEGTLRLGSNSALPSIGRSVAFQGGAALANTTAPVLDIDGRNASIFSLFLNTATPAVAGISSSVVDSASGGLLTLGSGLQYQGGGAQQNGPSTVSAALSLGAASRTFLVNDSALTSTEVTLSGGVTGAAGAGLTKDGAGVLALSGAITYSGNTAVSAGTLSLGSVNSSNDASTVSVDSGAVLNLAYAGTDTVSSLVIGGVAQPAGVYGATEFPGVLTGSGTITVTAIVDPYLTWAGPGAPFDGDANNDGVANGLAWLLGASGPNVSALDKLPLVAELPGGGLQLTFNMLPSSARGGASLALQHSSDLGISDLWASVIVPDATGGSAPVTFVVSGANPLNVVATVASSEAVGGKLFGRLRANR